MPQTSLSAWLSRPASLQRSLPAGLPEAKSPHHETNEHASVQYEAQRRQHGESTEQILSTTSAIQTEGQLRRLPTNVEIRACRKEDISHLKRLNGLLLQIPYPESYYREIIEDPLTNNITLVAVWHDNPQAATKEKGRLIGAIRCRILAHPPGAPSTGAPAKDGPMLYLSTLVLLSPYRTHGIASQMLAMLIKRAVAAHGVTSVGAHVWEANTEGLEWYRKRGFAAIASETGYYKRLSPSTAVVMEKIVGVMDLVGD